MDEGRFSISADDLYQRLGSAAAPIVIDARRAPALEADERMVVVYCDRPQRKSPPQRPQEQSL